jgi:hypothetical protein
VGKDSHRNEHDQKIDENSHIGQDAEFLQSSYLTNCKAKDCPDQTAHSVAEFEFGHLGKGLPVADDDNTNGYQEL